MTYLHLLSLFRKFCAASLLAVLSLGAGTSAHAQLLDAKAFFDWAETTYPALFPGHPADQSAGTFTYRYYPTSLNALGVSDGAVYALGPFSNNSLYRIDTLAAFQCLVYPARCTASLGEVGVAGLHYGNTATFTLTGSGLDQVGLTVGINKCTGHKVVASVDPRARNVSCTVVGVGDLSLVIRDAAGTLLLSRVFTVPEPQVKLQTSVGDVVVQLNPTAAALTVNNFLTYVNTGFFNGTLFHRVVPGLVAQGGGYTKGPVFKAPTFAPIKLESNNGLSNVRGSIGMARTSDPDSATSQFYFNLVDNLGFNYTSSTSRGYAVFGTIVQGLSVLDQIATVPTFSTGGLTDVPVTDVVILSAQQVQ